MNQAALAGLLVGAAVGILYAWWQIRTLTRQRAAEARNEPPQMAAQFRQSTLRVVMLMLILVLVQVAPPERLNRWWLAGSLIVCYSVPFFYRLWQLWKQQR